MWRGLFAVTPGWLNRIRRIIPVDQSRLAGFGFVARPLVGLLGVAGGSAFHFLLD